MKFPVISSGQMAEVDRIAVENGLLVMQMMEYAALNIARFAQRFAPKEILILAGKGHNGGDGIAAARHLKNWGYKVTIMLPDHPENLKKTSKHHSDLVELMGIDTEIWNASDFQSDMFISADLIIDALIGYSIKGDPHGAYKDLILEANSSKTQIIAIDIPSGMDGTTGKAGNPTINASQTLTLALPKTGITKKYAKRHTGDIYVADLGIPEFIYKKAGIKVPPGLFKKESIKKFIPS